MKPINQKGFAALESLFVTVSLVALVAGGLSLIYYIFAKIWLDRSAYEASICLSTSEIEQSCENGLRDSILSALPIGSIVRIDLKRTQDLVAVDVLWEISDGFALKIHDERRLPLEDGSYSEAEPPPRVPKKWRPL